MEQVALRSLRYSPLLRVSHPGHASDSGQCT